MKTKFEYSKEDESANKFEKDIDDATQLIKDVFHLNGVKIESGLVSCIMIIIEICKQSSISRENFMFMISEVWDNAYIDHSEK